MFTIQYMAHKQPQQHKTRSRFRMSRAAKQTLSKIHKTVTCNADFSTYRIWQLRNISGCWNYVCLCQIFITWSGLYMFSVFLINVCHKITYDLLIFPMLFVCLMVFQQHSSYIVAVSFISGGNQRTRRKPQTCRKSLTNFIT